ncbi:hypothetical protein U9M48_000860, partial [Paspalum notatum var. saurae]
MEFVQFILEENSGLRKLVNMQLQVKAERTVRDGDTVQVVPLLQYSDTALHLAVEKCNPDMVSALPHHPDIDITVIDKDNCAAIWRLAESESKNYAKTINWNKIFWLILDEDSRAENDIYNLHEEIKNKIIAASREAVKSLTETCTGNTSLVAILIATITFAAAFTLPGEYSSSAESEGLPIMARKVAFQAFLIFDTLGMCSSLAVAFICVIAKWMDFEFLLHYRSLTKKLMWFAYMTTTLAFATGLYTVLSSRVHWLDIAICVLSVSLPILITLISEWPIWMLRLRYRKPFNANFIEMQIPLSPARLRAHDQRQPQRPPLQHEHDDEHPDVAGQEWEQCMVHRDIKPGNVMLDPSFNAKLGDFGLAIDHAITTHTTVLAGTAAPRATWTPESV